MPVELLIDGYNLLHNAGLGRTKFRPGQFEQARNRLLKRLQTSLTEAERAHTSIIFDAQFAEHSDRRPLNIYGMTVLFSPHGRQADDLIEIVLASHPQPQQVMVISSDHRLQRAARIAHAGSLSSDAFLVELDERRLNSPGHDSTGSATPHPASPGKPQPLAPEEIDHWLEEFRHVDVGALMREVHNESRSLPPAPSSPAPSPPDPSSPDPSKPHRASFPADASPGPTQSPSAPPDPSLPDPSTVHHMSDWLKGVTPLKSSPNAGRTPRLRRNAPNAMPGTPSEENDLPEAIPPTELNFWCQRVEEMLREENPPDSPSG